MSYPTIIRDVVIDELRHFVSEYDYQYFDEFPTKFKNHLYGLVLATTTNDQLVFEVLMIDDFLHGFFNSIYNLDDLKERVSDFFDPIFDEIINELREERSNLDDESKLNKYLDERDEAQAINKENRPIC